MWIQFASNAHRVNANSIRIRTESSVKGPLVADFMIGGRQAVLSVTCACITCTWNSVKPREQIMRQLPLERISVDYMFC